MMSLIYLDSSVVIYLVERHPIYAPQIEFALSQSSGSILATSALVQLEVLVKPMQDGRNDLITLYRQFLNTSRALPISDATFMLALELRAQYRLKTPDALHLAVARQHNCDLLWTNDNRLAAAAGEQSVNILAPA
jgi:predicted nucleic acid-binding protein